MPDAILMHKDDVLGSGQTTFENTGVLYGDDGITGLLHNVPLSQNEWAFGTTGMQVMSTPMDATTKRIPTRVASGETASKVATLAKRILLPRDFGTFPLNSFKVIVRRHGSISAAALTLYNPGASADPSVDGVSIVPTNADEFEQFVMSPSGFYQPNDFLTLVVSVTTAAVDVYLEVCDIEMTIRNKRGNI